ncbi:MAG: DNA-protecting protein DprA [Candidatus Moranbacteria bacterium]|nr:DNA-protecting protein DprA [Candidatus Moranbacteria bacterium]
MEDHIYWHCFRKIAGIGQTRLRSLMTTFPSGEAAWHADTEALARTGMSRDTLDAILAGRAKIDPESEKVLLEREGIRILLETDECFPVLLREAPFPVSLLYVRGVFDEWDRPMVAIVGSRRHTAYGRQVAEHIAEDLSSAGIVVVSGLAYGIDSVAHQATLRADGPTIAVLGDGLDDISIHPKDHLPLARRIMESGCLLSEYPPGTAANRGTFPARNRIIAALSYGVVVIEATEKSGSLITADHALECGRDVFAIPGSIFSPASTGTHRLIRDGAKLVRGVGDIIEELPFHAHDERTGSTEKTTGKPVPSDLSPSEQKILSLLSHEATHVDEIIKSSHLGTSDAGSALTMLEIKGIAKNIGGDHFIRL